MASPTPDRSQLVFALLCAWLLLGSPLLVHWATPPQPWYAVYLGWGGIVALIYAVAGRRG